VTLATKWKVKRDNIKSKADYIDIIRISKVNDALSVQIGKKTEVGELSWDGAIELIPVEIPERERERERKKRNEGTYDD